MSFQQETSEILTLAKDNLARKVTLIFGHLRGLESLMQLRELCSIPFTLNLFNLRHQRDPR